MRPTAASARLAGCEVITATSVDHLPPRPRRDISAVALDASSKRRGLSDLLRRTADAFPAAKILVTLDRDDYDDERVATTLPAERVQAVLIHPVSETQLAAGLERLCLLSDVESGAGADQQVATPQESYLVGESPVMRTVFDQIRRIAGTDAPVLVTGESGTGKELAARALHDLSDYAEGPFVAINCGAIPTDLIASELFGHEKGAFTGASQRKLGRVETARDGTLFLDEIADLPLTVQAHLLRFLQEGTIERVGGIASIHVHTRIVAGTNANLMDAVREGRFREDLFYRLNVFHMEMPPLRTRGDDVLVLAHFFLRHFTKDANGTEDSAITFAPSAIQALKTHDWPGNVRELISAVRRGAVMCRGGRITAADIGLKANGVDRDEDPPTLAQARQEAERSAISKALRLTDCRVGKAAARLGISRITLYKLIRKHGLEAADYHSG